MPPHRSFGACLTKMRDAPWSQVFFGEDPYMVLVLLVVGAFVLYPVLDGFWPLILGLLLVAGFWHAWLWCREHDAEGQPADRPEDGGRPT